MTAPVKIRREPICQPDRPYRDNLAALAKVRANWREGTPQADATTAVLKSLRHDSARTASEAAIDLLNRGVAPRSLFDAYLQAAAELMMRSPGILSLHATTFTNAVHYAFQRCQEERTRQLLLLQNAAFLPLFRRTSRGTEIDTLEPLPLASSGPGAIEEIFAEMGRDRLTAARKILAFLEQHRDPAPLADAARRLIFLKGTDSHDYKYSSAVLEDHASLAPPGRNRFLAGAAFYLKPSSDPDNPLVQRTRAALAG